MHRKEMETKIFWSPIPGTKIINSEISQLLIKTIKSEKQQYRTEFNDLIEFEEFCILKEKYNKLKKTLPNRTKPKISNYIFYLIISDTYPDFSWKVCAGKKQKSGQPYLAVITNNYTEYSGVLLSLAMFMLGRVRSMDFVDTKKELGFNLNRPSSTEFEILHFFSSISVNKMNVIEFGRIHSWFLRALKKNKATIFTGICPDYAYDVIGKNLYRFTFDGLNDGIGPSGLRFKKNFNQIYDFFKAKNIEVSYIAAIGDFESYSSINLNRVGETEESFIAKLRISQKILEKKIGNKRNIIFPLIAEFFGGKNKWTNKFEYIHSRMLENDFGQSDIDESKLIKISASRMPLLERWFPEISSEEVRKFIIWQAAEYATISEFVKERFSDPLIIGCDHFKMMPFFNFGGEQPIFYLTSNYMENN